MSTYIFSTNGSSRSRSFQTDYEGPITFNSTRIKNLNKEQKRLTDIICKQFDLLLSENDFVSITEPTQPLYINLGD